MADAPITVTLKSGKGYEAHWVVFKGDSVREVRDHLVDYFEIETDDAASLNDVVFLAEQVLHGMGNVKGSLGGSVVKTEKQQAAPKEEAKPEGPDLFAGIAAADSLDALTSLWAENKAAFDTEVTKAFKARVAVLKAAAE